MSAKDNNKPSYNCDMCEKVYQTKYKLSQHVRNKHNIILDENKPVGILPKTGKINLKVKYTS